MRTILTHWNTPIHLCPKQVQTNLLQDIRDAVKQLEPTWRHRWPHTLAALKLISPDGLLPETLQARISHVLRADRLPWSVDIPSRLASALIATRKASMLKTTSKKLKLVTWSVNGVSPHGHLSLCPKQRFITHAAKDAIIVLTETKWQEGDDTRQMCAMGGTQIWHTPARITDAEGPSVPHTHGARHGKQKWWYTGMQS